MPSSENRRNIRIRPFLRMICTTQVTRLRKSTASNTMASASAARTLSTGRSNTKSISRSQPPKNVLNAWKKRSKWPTTLSARIVAFRRMSAPNVQSLARILSRHLSSKYFRFTFCLLTNQIN
jgi:hypothetical protein